jgi:coproporphyrinogen III oxidase
MNKEEIQEFFRKLQDHICNQLEKADGKAEFQEDKWQREGGGGGRTRVISDGNVLAKGGVNFSAVYGDTPEKILKALKVNGSEFLATGVSIVLHPVNPWVPIIHMNVRYFEMSDGTRWFGGGIDLTPHYVIPEDAQYFHSRLKEVCDRHSSEFYPEFKTWADEYFYLPHRQETRGIGGIFFDKLSGNHEAMEKYFGFVKDVGMLFPDVYTELINRNRDKPFGERELKWQALRRGRYVEFNLIHDKGTKFGLDSDGRTESILMSLPPVANWEYNYQPEPGSSEQTTLNYLKKGINWI